jgi:hypothetical protein
MRFTDHGFIDIDSLGLSPVELAAFRTIIDKVEDAAGNDGNTIILLAAGLARATCHGMEYYAADLGAASIVRHATGWCLEHD